MYCLRVCVEDPPTLSCHLQCCYCWVRPGRLASVLELMYWKLQELEAQRRRLGRVCVVSSKSNNHVYQLLQPLHSTSKSCHTPGAAAAISGVTAQIIRTHLEAGLNVRSTSRKATRRYARVAQAIPRQTSNRSRHPGGHAVSSISIRGRSLGLARKVCLLY